MWMISSYGGVPQRGRKLNIRMINGTRSGVERVHNKYGCAN